MNQQHNGEFEYFIKIDEEIVLSEVNTEPRDFEDMKAYAGDQFHEPANAILKNILIETGLNIYKIELTRVFK